jgi:hypothetical protein
MLQPHLHITLPLPLTTMEIFNTVQNFVTEKKIGEVLWMNEENDKLEMGIVMLKEHAEETMMKIKEHPEFHRDRFGGERNNGCGLYTKLIYYIVQSSCSFLFILLQKIVT